MLERAGFGQFLSLYITPGLALGGLFAALQGWARLSARRKWADVTPEEWRSAKRQLAAFSAGYPALWVLTTYIVRFEASTQRVVMAVCALVLFAWGANLGHRFRERSVVGEVR